MRLASFLIFILSIFRSLGCFFVIPPHRVNSAVHLHIPDQFIFSHTTPVCFFTFITRPLFLLFFFIHLRLPSSYPFFQPFFFPADISANVVIFTWVSVFLSIYRNFSKSTGPIRFLFFLLLKYIPDTILLFQYVTQLFVSIITPLT